MIGSVNERLKQISTEISGIETDACNSSEVQNWQ